MATGTHSLHQDENVLAETLTADTVTAGALTASSTVTLSAALVGGIQTLTGAGAVNLTTLITEIVTTGADALTLADGADGQIKIITMKTDGGDGTLTPTNLAGGSTLTFGDVGDSVILCFIEDEWHILSNNGATLA